MDPPSYPPLSSLLPEGGIGPGGTLGGLTFLDAFGQAVGDLATDLLEPLGYRDLSIEFSEAHDVAQYRFTVVAEKPVKLDLLAGLNLVLLPDTGSGGSAAGPGSAVGVTFTYQWPIRAYVRRFRAGGDPGRAAFDLFLQLAGITDKELYARLLSILAPSQNDYAWLIQKLSDWNQDFQDPGIASGTEIDQILGGLEALDVGVYQAAFEAVIKDAASFDLDLVFQRLRDLFEDLIGEIDRKDFEALLLPQFQVRLDSLGAALEFPTSVLRPLDGSPVSRLSFTAGAVTYDTRTGFDVAIDEGLGVSLTPSEIGKTGLTLQIDGCKLDLSRAYNIPEALADQRPVDFVGVYFKTVAIGLPKKWFSQPTGTTLGIVGRSVLIGTGGITGTIGLEALVSGKPLAAGPAPTGGAMLEFTLGPKPAGGGPRQGFKVGFSLFHLKFRQNVLLESRIKGELTIPKLQAQPIGVELFIAADGDFRLTASSSPPVDIKVPNVFIFKCSKVAVGKDDDRIYLETSGDLSFANNNLLKDLLKTPIHIEKFLINSDGSFELEGGSIPLPSSATIKVGPAKIAITALHFGAHEQVHQGELRKYRYWGFDGGVSVNPGGVDCRGDGIKFYFTVDDKPLHCFLRIEGIGIDLVIPGTASKDQAVLILKGYLSLKNPEYLGSISFSLPKVKIAGGGTMKYNTSYPAWAVDVWLELPMPILVGSTGLGIYGFRGLFGLRYIASKQAITKPTALPADASWGDYYRAPQPSKGLHVDKLMLPDKTGGAKNPFSVGAGVSLATAQDKGKAFSSQLFLLVSLPNLIMLEGRADILAKQRVGLTDGEPPYYAYLALSPESIELGAGVNYLIPKETGETLNLTAVFEAAYFWRNSSAWYVHFGTKAKPMTARILDMLDGYAYLMLSASGIEAGAGVHFEFSKSYGPVSVDAYAYLDTWAYLSFERSQAGGGIALGGHVDVTFMKVGFYISLDAGLTVEVPTPYRVAGYVEICVTVNLKVKKFTKCVDLNFEWQRSNQVDMSPVEALIAPPAAPAPPPAVAVHMMSGATYPVEFSTSPNMAPTALNDWAIPLDAYIDVKLGKRVDPLHATGARIGGATTPPAGQVETLPPRYGSRIVEHRYSLERVALEVLGPNGWRDYRPYEAIAGEGFVTSVGAQDIASMPVGLWQKQDEGYGQMRFLALTPFSFVGPTDGHRPEEMGVTAASLYCVAPERPEQCLVWREPRDLASGVDHFRDGTLYRVDGAATGSIPGGGAPSLAPAGTAGPPPCRLAIGEGGRATFQLPGPAVSCRIRATSQAPHILLRFQRLKPSGPVRGPDGLVWPPSPPEYEDVRTETVARADLNKPIVYDDAAAPIRRIVLETPAPDRRALAALEEALALRQDEWYRADERARPKLRAEMDGLAAKLREEHARTCVGGTGGGGGDPDETGVIEALEQQLAALLAEIGTLAAAYNSACVPHPAPDPECARLAAEIAALEARAETLKRALDRQPDGLRAAIAEELAALETRARDRERARAALDEQLAGLRAGIAALEQRAEALRSALAELDKPATPEGPRSETGEERKRALAALNEQLGGLSAEMEAKAARYKLACVAQPRPDPREGRPVQGPSRPVIWPPMPRAACDQLAAEIAALETGTEALKRRIAELDRLAMAEGPRGESGEAWACGTFVEEICWLSEEDWRYNGARPDIAAIAADYDPMRRAVECAVAPIWRPHQTYRITLVVRDTVKAGDKVLPDMDSPPDQPLYVHFRTRGPIGSFRPPPQPKPDDPVPPLEDPRPDSPEQFLKYYIDRERSFPDPGGDLLYAKPLFYRDVVLGLRLAKPHAFHFFANWPDYGLGPCHYEMAIRVKDPTEAVPSSADPDYAAAIVTSPILGEQKWNPVAAPPTPELNLLNNLHDPLAGGASNATACLSQGTKGPVKPAALAVETELGDLLPNKLYTAVVLNRRLDVTPPTEAEVHRYPFKTSRYPDFAAQIGSHVLDAEPDSLKLAVFAVDHDLADATGAAAAYAAALAIVKRQAAADPAFPDYFDRLLYGHLKLAPLPPAANLEFNFVTNALTGDTYGLWIRGPEALNDPRAPRLLRQSAVALQYYGAPRADSQIILSKDGCQAFIMIDGGPMPTGDLSVAFGLLAPDGLSVAQTVVTGTLTMPREV
ncbi:MAG TPA: hypothetical protein VFP12_04195 [Allosphingosinicella sp.]|nr:hypothetical protein [Allosphingosinicella sp.]